MNKIILFISILFISFSLVAQNEVAEKMKKSDKIVFNCFMDIWQNALKNAALEAYNPGISYSTFQDNPIGNSHFSIAYGLGFSFHNMYSASFLKYDSLWNSNFVEIDKDIKYKKNKHTFAYLNTPVELRYRAKGKNSFKVSLGFNFGVLLQEHHKYIGDDFMIDKTKHTIKLKEYKHKNIEFYRYSVSARVGYKWFNIFGDYALNSIFKDGKGPNMYPISVGISLIPPL